MKLRELIVERAIVPSLASTRREDAVRELVAALVASGRLSADLEDAFVKAVIDREKKGSTGLGHGVATPHAKHPSVRKPFAALGISRTGVEFGAIDRQPVHAIFLLISPQESPELHLEAIQAVYAQLKNEQFRRFLRQAASVEDVRTLLDEADAGQIGR